MNGMIVWQVNTNAYRVPGARYYIDGVFQPWIVAETVVTGSGVSTKAWYPHHQVHRHHNRGGRR